MLDHRYLKVRRLRSNSRCRRTARPAVNQIFKNSATKSIASDELRGVDPCPMRMKLEESSNTVIFYTMNAAEIIQEIERLPEEERGKVIEFMRHQPKMETLEAMREPTDDLPRFETVEALFDEMRG